MVEELTKHWTAIIQEYTSGPHRDTLLEAKEKYFEMTGVVNEDEDEYESRMQCFNDWYVSQFISDRGTTTVIKDYITRHDLNEKISNALTTIRHSLFVYAKINFKKQMVLKDLLHNEKIALDKEHPHVGIIEDDVFTGRIITYEDKNYLLSGLCLFPQEVKSRLAKQAKKVRKLGEQKEEFDFLMKLESLKTKWLRYGHIDSNKIFVFE